MIFHLTKEYLDSLTGPQISDACCELVKNCHFIKTDDGDTLQRIKDAVREHASSTQKLVFNNSRLTITTLQDTYLKTIVPDSSMPYKCFYWLTSKPGYLIMENSHNEWEIYAYILDLHQNDSDFGNLFKDLKKAFEDERIEPRHAGGHTELIKAKNQITCQPAIANKYVNLKTVLLFDRDTLNDTYYDSEKRDLFKHCCGKTHTKVTDGDIYALNQPKMGWHMWYKRSIENYFDDNCYTACGMGLINCDGLHRDYVKIENGNPSKYKKSELINVASNIDRSRLESGLKQFHCPEAGKNISEMQLFLLKLVRIM